MLICCIKLYQLKFKTIQNEGLGWRLSYSVGGIFGFSSSQLLRVCLSCEHKISVKNSLIKTRKNSLQVLLFWFFFFENSFQWILWTTDFIASDRALHIEMTSAVTLTNLPTSSPTSYNSSSAVAMNFHANCELLFSHFLRANIWKIWLLSKIFSLTLETGVVCPHCFLWDWTEHIWR